MGKNAGWLPENFEGINRCIKNCRLIYLENLYRWPYFFGIHKMLAVTL